MLCVDDEPNVLEGLSLHLRSPGRPMNDGQIFRLKEPVRIIIRTATKGAL
jgi:hypothetical protein